MPVTFLVLASLSRLPLALLAWSRLAIVCTGVFTMRHLLREGGPVLEARHLHDFLSRVFAFLVAFACSVKQAGASRRDGFGPPIFAATGSGALAFATQ